MQSRSSQRPRIGGRLGVPAIASAIAVLAVGTGVASAQTEADPTDPTATQDDASGTFGPAAAAAGGGGTGPGGGGTGGGGGGGDGGGGGSGGGGGGDGRLKLAEVDPGKVFYSGTASAKFRFEIGGGSSRDLKIELVNKNSHDVVRDWNRTAEPGDTYSVAWRGSAEGGKAAKGGRYFFRVRVRGGDVLRTGKAAKSDRYFRYFTHKFPIRGRHDYGDGLGAGRGHQGQDVFARCGTELQAARAGKVTTKAYQGSGAGYYIVIDGKSTGKDYVYMHLKKPAPVRKGEKVRTGQRIGKVGATGNASGCHLHFELWSAPGWYNGGNALNPTKKLKAWDSWS